METWLLIEHLANRTSGRLFREEVAEAPALNPAKSKAEERFLRLLTGLNG